MRKISIAAIAVCVAILTPQVIAQALTFHYGFIGQNDNQQLYVIEDGAALVSGAKLQLNFEYPEGNWFYVCYLSSTDEYALLYTSNPALDRGLASSDGLEKNDEVIFDSLGWLALDDNVGTETFTCLLYTSPSPRD